MQYPSRMYQADGIAWMHQTLGITGGLILADEMGLGKTIQIIALLLLDPPSIGTPALVVCPTSLIANWQREIAKFGPSLSVLLHRGPYRTGITSGLRKAQVVIATYDTVVNDIGLISGMRWSWVIVDEAQAIKNPESNRRQALACIPRDRTIPMTGTPVENSLTDLWSLADFAITGAGVKHEHLYMEKVSGRKREGRAALEDLLARGIRKGDTVVCTRLDRLARSTRDLLQIAQTLEDKGVNLKVLEQPVDTTNAAGKLFFTILGAFGEFEASIRAERQREGIDAALATGDDSPFKGRPATIEGERIKALDEQGKTPTSIAKELNIARSSVYRYLSE